MAFFPTLASVAPKAESTPERKPEGELKKGYNPSNADLLSKLRQSQELEYSPNTFAGKESYKGIVVYNPLQDGQKAVPGDYQVRVRVYIKELHGYLGKPTTALLQGKGGDTVPCQMAALYPEFVATSLEEIGLTEQPKLGQELSVRFIDRYQTTHHYNNGFILGPTGDWGATVVKLKIGPLRKAVRDNCKALEKKFQKMAPPGAEKVDDTEGGGAGGPPAPGRDTTTEQQRRGGFRMRTLDPPVRAVKKKKPAPKPLDAKKAECDTKYVLEQLRNQFDFTEPTPQVIAALNEKIWWSESTATALAGLHPSFRPLVVKMLTGLATTSDPLYLIVAGQGAVRSLATQRMLYAKGQLPPGTVLEDGRPVIDWTKDLKCAAGSPGCKVTDAQEGESPHNYSLAIDLMEFKDPLPVHPKGSQRRRGSRVTGYESYIQHKYSRYAKPGTDKKKNNPNEFARNKDKEYTQLYRDIGIACIKYGMRWGGEFDDPRHCEMKGFKWREAFKKVQAQDFIPGTKFIKVKK